MQFRLFISFLLLAMCLIACSGEKAEDSTTDQTEDTQGGNTNTTDEAEDDVALQNEEHSDTVTSTDTADIPPAALIIEQSMQLALGQKGVSGIASFTETDENGDAKTFDTYYTMSDIVETFEDGTHWPEFYRSYIQQTLPDGDQLETYFSFGKSLFTQRDGEWYGNTIDETMDIGFHYRLNYFTPYIWLNYFGPFLESVAPFEVYGTDYVVEADINEPGLQEFFENNFYMLAEENSIYHYNEWTFVDEPAHIYLIFNKENSRLTEVGAVVKMENEEYGVYEFNYVQQFDDFEVESIELPEEVIQATGVSEW